MNPKEMSTAGRGYTGNQRRFAETPDVSIPRSILARSHRYITTLDSGFLAPCFVDEVLPGDTMSLSYSTFCRMVTPLKPLMDNLYLDFQFWFVPCRLVWSNWQKFMGEQDNPGDSVSFRVPILDNDGAPSVFGNQWIRGTMGDYFGIPTYVTKPGEINALPFRCVNLIWNTWYRDQNLQDSLTVPLDDGPDDPGFYSAYGASGGEFLPRRGKRHDYFSSCLPFPQKGAAVSLPLGTLAPVMGIGAPDTATYGGGPVNVREAGGIATTYAANTAYNVLQGGSGASDDLWIEEDPNNAGYPNIYADLSSASAATINELRTAFAVQRLFERDARGGTRYIEILRSHFGVVSPDARLQRPEYLGGSTQSLHVNTVAQTAFGSDGKPISPNQYVGDLAAFVTSGHSGRGFAKSFVEHGYIIGFANVRADITYQQGLHKMWSRRDKTDFYWPALAHLGEQAVLNKEIYLDGVDAGSDGLDEEVFGYIPRYDEYRFKPSQVTGVFRSVDPSSLDIWTVAIDFGSRPVLNDEFIEDNPPVSRVVANTTEPEFKLDIWYEYKNARPMPAFGQPGMIDHF